MAEEQKNVKKETGRISRREFLKDAGLVVGGATLGSVGIFNACSNKVATTTITSQTTKTSIATVTVTNPVTVTTTSAVVAVDSAFINLTVNGAKYELSVGANWNLRYLLHDEMGLTGVKDMCGSHGQCGTCSVILDGRPVLSCMTLAIECDGKTIETAEGIGQSGHPLIDAYVKYDCMQCGYCTPGFVVTAKALLDRNSNPTEQEVKEALAGNLCRCGTYPQHPKAVLEAASVLRGS